MKLQELGRLGHWVDTSKLNKDSVIVDAGACTGEFIEEIRKYVDCNIIAIEPNPKNFKILEEKNFKNVRTINRAMLGKDEDGPTTFYAYPQGEIGNIFNLYPGAEDKFIIRTLGIEDVIEDKIDYLKMDIEGAEDTIFSQMSPETASKINQISVEVHKNTSIREIMSRLENLGFECQIMPRSEIYAVRKKIHNFVHYPRTGGTFIAKWLETAFNYTLPTSMIPGLTFGKEGWGVIRNPFDFYVSLFFFQNEEVFKIFLQETLKNKNSYYWCDSEYLKKYDIGLATYCFIYFFCDYEKVFSLKKIDDLGKYIIVDKIIKYDSDLRKNIERTFKLSEKEKGLLYDTAPIRVSKDKKPFMDYYNKELMDIVLHKDRLLFKLYPEYEKCTYNKS